MTSSPCVTAGIRPNRSKARLTPWLAARGLAFNEDKTRVVGLDEGFDFLGFNVRRYGDKLLIKPSAGAVKRIRRRLSDEMLALRGANAPAVISRINPIVRGWAAYYRGVVATETFQELDEHLWRLTYKWALYRHNRRSKHRIVDRYYGQFHPSRRDRWVFGDRDSGAYLTKFDWTKIVRHDLVKGRSSPDDPALTGYWAKRRRKNGVPPIGRTRQLLLHRQKGRCPVCNGLLLHADRQPQSPQEWERWAAAVQVRGDHMFTCAGYPGVTRDGIQDRGHGVDAVFGGGGDVAADGQPVSGDLLGLESSADLLLGFQGPQVAVG